MWSRDPAFLTMFIISINYGLTKDLIRVSQLKRYKRGDHDITSDD
jgi:hypothetical protein